MRERVKKVLGGWGFTNCEDTSSHELMQLSDTIWQFGNKYVLKVYTNFEILEKSVKVLCMLDEMKVPVGRVVPACNGALYLAEGDYFFYLSEKLMVSDWERMDEDKNLPFRMGEAIADLHIALKHCEQHEVFEDNSLLDEMNGWVKDNFIRSGWKYIELETYEKVVSGLADIYDRLPRQLIHRDVHFGNFLFYQGELSGYIDFDLCQRNIRIFDLCYFLAGLLAEAKKEEITEEYWFVFAKNVFIGYEKKCRLSEEEKKAVPYVMECIELLCTSFYEGIGNTRLAKDSFKIFEFVRTQEKYIQGISNTTKNAK